MTKLLTTFVLVILSAFIAGCVSNSSQGTAGSTGGSAVNRVRTSSLTATTNEDQAVTVTLSYVSDDNYKASSCSLSSLANIVVAQACSCDSAGVCTVGVKGSSNFNGTASFRYQINAGGLDSTISTVTVTIAAVADVPSVSNTIITDLIYEDVASGNLILRYNDPDGDRAGASDCSITSESNLTVTQACSCDVILGYCTLKIKGTADYYGPASFSYSIRANGDWSNTATASLTISAVDDAPVASNVTAPNFNEDTSSIITLSYSDVENNAATSCAISNLTNLSITQACACSVGVCTVGVKGTNNYNGNVSFNFTVSSNGLTSNSATVSSTIDPVDDAPLANNISPSAFNEDQQSIITLSYSDAESDLATSCSISSPSNVTVTQACSCDGSGVCTVGVTGTSQYNGAASFGYTVTSNGLNSNIAIASLTINPVNDAPVISTIADQYMPQDQNLTVSFTISDIDSTLNCSSSVTASSSNTTLLPNANVVFSGTSPNCSAVITPATGNNGSTNLTFSVSDGSVSSSDTFVVTVRAAVSKTWLMGDVGDTDTYALSSASIAKTSAGVAYLVPTQLNQTHSVLADFATFPADLTWDGVTSSVKRAEFSTAPFNSAYSSYALDGLKATTWNSISLNTTLPSGKGLPDFPVISLIPLEETTGNVVEKYNAITFTKLGGNPTYNVVSKIGKGITFASAPYFEAAYSKYLNPTIKFSVCSWVKPAAVGAGYKSIITSRDTNKGYALYVNNKFEFWIGNGSSYTQLVSSTTPSTTAFMFVCGMFDGTTATLTVNGIAEATATTTFVPNTTMPTRIAAGTTETTASQFFNGTIDNISIFNRDLATAELTGLNGLTKTLPQAVSANLGNHLFNHETTTDYSLLASSTLLSSLVSLWHFDDPLGSTSIRNGANRSLNAIVGSIALNVAGKINKAATFDGSTGYFTSRNSVSTSVSTSAFTISAWIKTTSAANSQIISYAAAHSPLGINAGKLQITINSVVTAGTATINDGQWHHVVVSGTGGACKVYLDGNTATPDINYACATFAMGSTATVGRLSGTASNYYNGSLDEVAVWTRALSTTEIQQLYRRGVNSYIVNVRGCNLSDCSDGVYGSNNFSEINNVDSLGNVYATPPVYNFSITGKRYLQYQINFKSDIAANAVELKKVVVGPNHFSYPTTGEYIVPQSGLSFKSLSSLTENLGTNGCNSGVRYQLSADKINWKYFDGSSWVTGTSYATANSLSSLNAGLSSYVSASPTVSDTVYIRAFLMSNIADECELDSLVLNGNN